MSEFDEITEDNFYAIRREAWEMINQGRKRLRAVELFEQQRRRNNLKSVLPPVQIRLLRELVEMTWDDPSLGRMAVTYRRMCAATGCDRRTVSRALTPLCKLGLAEYVRGLMTEDGEVAGSGYSATEEGRTWLNECDKSPPHEPG